MTAGKVQSTEGPPTDAVSGATETDKTEDLGEEIPSTPSTKGSSASDGPGIIHCE